jgi:hypothetical protein
MSQVSQRSKQEGTGVHALHAAGSSSVSSVQLAIPASVEPAKTKRPLRAGISQQPKQSQPFGTSGLQ